MGKIQVPQIVVNRLEMPQAPARVRVERDDGIGKQVQPEAIAAPEVGACGFSGRIDDAPFFVDRMS